ncbi:PIN domain-containing protein [Candidatus Woesearchaeota archaeon]|nr:PIN domain-containing protein [Candidatus Woesearchaeota archaeon]
MKGVDTTFLIDLLRNDPQAVEKGNELDSYPVVYASEASVFEVVTSVFAKAENMERALHDAERLFHQLRVLPVDHASAVYAGRISGLLMRKGLVIDPVDCLIAGSLLAQGCTTIVTRNVKHFNRIPGLNVERY